MKKITLLMMIVMVMMFSGCSSIAYSVVQYSSGNVTQVLRVELDDSIIDEQLKVDVIEITEEYISSIIKSYPNIIPYINAEYEWSDNVFLATIEYTERGYEILTDGASTEWSVENGIFADTYYVDTYTIYAISNVSDYYDIMMENYGEYVDDDIEYYYCYASNSSRLHSDADNVIESDGYTYHIWTLSDEDFGQSIRYYYYSVNNLPWYILALCITLIFGISLYVKYIIDKKKRS